MARVVMKAERGVEAVDGREGAAEYNYRASNYHKKRLKRYNQSKMTNNYNKNI